MPELWALYKPINPRSPAADGQAPTEMESAKVETLWAGVAPPGSVVGGPGTLQSPG